MQQYKKILTIAGSDSGGCAGIQADIKTASAHGVFAASAITAVTAQNTKGVTSIYPLPVDFLEQQLEAVLSDIGADAIKIGMLHSSAVVCTVARVLQKYSCKNVVLDPVMVATSGDRLIEEETVAYLAKELFPMARIITPNLPEAEILTGQKFTSCTDMERLVAGMTTWGNQAVLLKGGHMAGSQVLDLLYSQAGTRRFEQARINTKNTHGTGCSLSAAIAANLALGLDLETAVAKAISYLRRGLQRGKNYHTGGGAGPIWHFP